MVNVFVVLFDDAKSVLAKLFKAAKNDGPAVLNVINEVTPEAEILFTLIDPAAAAVADPIITEVQGDFVTIYNMAKAGDFSSISSFVTSIKANLGTLATASHITDPNSLAKAQGIVSAISSALNSVLAAA